MPKLVTINTDTPLALSGLPAPARLTIASRQSRLAIWQAEHVKHALQRLYPLADIRIRGMTTRGDQIVDRALAPIGGKGLFVKELEAALADGRADLAVHSLKDVPVTLPAGFTLAAVMTRDDPRDAVVSNRYASLAGLPPDAVVGTSSLRRAAMLRKRYQLLQVRALRGNLETRLAKLDRGDYDAIIVAAAGLQRLGLAERIRTWLEPKDSLPAAGQGALGIEICTARDDVAHWLAPLHDDRTAFAVGAERMVVRVLAGGCDVPLAAFAAWEDDGVTLRLRASIATTDGKRALYADSTAKPTTFIAAEALGRVVADALARQGAFEMVRALKPPAGTSMIGQEPLTGKP